QLAKLDAFRGELPALSTIIAIDGAGIPPRPDVLPLADVLARGRAARHDVEARARAIEPSDAAIFAYTSGTTGPPKGPMLTHGNIVAAMRAGSVFPMVEDDAGFSFLPLAHVLQRGVDYRGAWEGVPGSFGRSLDTVAEDLASSRPTVMAAVPRIFEKIYAKIHEQAASSPPKKKKIFDWALGVGKQVAKLRQARQAIPPALAAPA